MNSPQKVELKNDIKSWRYPIVTSIGSTPVYVTRGTTALISYYLHHNIMVYLITMAWARAMRGSRVRTARAARSDVTSQI